MKARAHVFIRGRVQGVFFRFSTMREARERGIAGWIRNLPDGSVEAVFEGEKGGVLEMIEFCRKGPPLAYVTDIDVRWEKFTNSFKDFKII